MSEPNVYEDARIQDGDRSPMIVVCARCGNAMGWNSTDIVSLGFARTGYRCDECDQVWQIILWDVTDEANAR